MSSMAISTTTQCQPTSGRSWYSGARSRDAGGESSPAAVSGRNSTGCPFRGLRRLIG
jgi:hypothetical protein